MTDIRQAAMDKLTEMGEDGTIEKMIAEQVEKTIGGIVADVLRPYGEVGKAMREAVGNALQFDAAKVDLPSYNKFLADVVRTQYECHIQENAAEHLAELVGQVLTPVEKRAKMSQLMEEIEEELGDAAREEGLDEIRIEVEDGVSSSAERLELVIHPPYHGDKTRVTFYNWNHDNDPAGWHIGYINYGGRVLTAAAVAMAGHCGGALVQRLFKYYAMGTRFEMDVQPESIYVGP